MSQDFLDINRGGAKQETESVGGGRELFNSGLQTAKIKQVYLDTYGSGAKFASVTLTIGGKDYDERLLLTNAKGEGFFTGNDGKPQQFSGLTRFDELLFAAGFPSAQAADIGPANIRAWDGDTRSFVIKSHATVVRGLAGKEVLVALLKISQNKQKKNPNTNKYDKLNEREDVNQIDKVANLQKVTQIEAAKGINPPTFMDAWAEKWTGKVKDTYKEQKGAPVSGTPTAAGNGGADAGDNIFG